MESTRSSVALNGAVRWMRVALLETDFPQLRSSKFHAALRARREAEQPRDEERNGKKGHKIITKASADSYETGPRGAFAPRPPRGPPWLHCELPLNKAQLLRYSKQSSIQVQLLLHDVKLEAIPNEPQEHLHGLQERPFAPSKVKASCTIVSRSAA